MKVPKEVKELYTLLNSEQINYIKSQYYYSVLECLERWRTQFENDYITIDEVNKLKNNQKEEAVRIASTIKRSGYLDREININQDFRFYMRLVLFFDYFQLLQSYEAKEEQDKLTIYSTNKIPIKGSIEAVGYIISELINKGYIEAPKRNGNLNKLAIARMIQEHFHYVDKENQPTTEQIRKSLFYDNSLSSDKQKLFKFPTYKQIHR
ncbi:hypothetical protein [Bergeyella zoohelcum]|uniref:hypothetical protein n=1 Tax=Bergeyella zoohelcum TaxID=1015 RepID=UPI002A90E22C|nr:hypothetical protein [Bergeyella zoohelcum]MDY6024672.1 hypothetical protein [Bergeyella zoohelcum]